MGTTAQHQAKAEHHLRFLKEISDEFPDWLAIVAFYAAVEFVEALFAERDLHSQRHEDRKAGIKNLFPSIFISFHKLYNASLDERYQAGEHGLDAATVHKELIERCLGHIQSFARSHLSKKNKSDETTC